MENLQQVTTLENKPMGIGYRLKLLRKTLNLTPEDFALSIGATTLTLSKWEKNESVPRNNFIQILVKVYKVNKKWIELGIGEMFQSNGLEENKVEEQSVSCNSEPIDNKVSHWKHSFRSELQLEDYKNTLPYDFAMEHGCGDAASSFFAAFCNMDDRQKQIVVDSFRAVVNVFTETKQQELADAEVELDKNSIAITESLQTSDEKQDKLFEDEASVNWQEELQEQNNESAKEQVVEEPPQKKKRQEPWKGRVLAARSKTNSLKTKRS